MVDDFSAQRCWQTARQTIRQAGKEANKTIGRRKKQRPRDMAMWDDNRISANLAHCIFFLFDLSLNDVPQPWIYLKV